MSNKKGQRVKDLKPGQLIVVGQSLMRVIRAHEKGVTWKRVCRVVSLN